jgi:hypothetical protein
MPPSTVEDSAPGTQLPGREIWPHLHRTVAAWAPPLGGACAIFVGQALARRILLESELPGADRASRQNVQHKPAQKLARRQHHLALFVANARSPSSTVEALPLKNGKSQTGE